MDIVKRAAERAEAAEAYREKRTGTAVAFNAGDLEQVKAEDIVGHALRIIQEGRLGFASTTGAKADGLVEAALLSAQHGNPAPFGFAGTAAADPVPVCHDATTRLPAEELIGWCEEAVREIERAFPEVIANAGAERGSIDVEVKTSAGLARHEERSYLSMGVEAQWVREGDIYTVSASQSVRTVDELDRHRLIEDVLRELDWGREVVPAITGTPPVLLLPSAMIVVLLPLFVGFSGMSVVLGTSPLKDRLGEQVFDPRITLWDDGRLPLGPRSTSFDDEGVPTTRLALAKKGVATSFFHDLRSAALAQQEPTGNGQKSGLMGGGFRSPPSPGPRNIVLEPGTGTLDDLLAEMGDGLIVADVLGLGQGNIASGSFSNNVGVGFVVRGGKVVGRVKNTMIAGNAYDVLKSGVQALGGEPEWVYGVLHVPPMLAGGVHVVAQ